MLYFFFIFQWSFVKIGSYKLVTTGSNLHTVFIFLFLFPLSFSNSSTPNLNLVLFVPFHMHPNQFNWQAYINLLQNYQQPPLNENPQHLPPLFPYMSLPPSSMSENSQNPPYFISYLPLLLPPLVIYNQPPSTKNSQSSQTFPLVPQNTFNALCKLSNSCSNA